MFEEGEASLEIQNPNKAIGYIASTLAIIAGIGALTVYSYTESQKFYDNPEPAPIVTPKIENTIKGTVIDDKYYHATENTPSRYIIKMKKDKGGILGITAEEPIYSENTSTKEVLNSLVERGTRLELEKAPFGPYKLTDDMNVCRKQASDIKILEQTVKQEYKKSDS